MFELWLAWKFFKAKGAEHFSPVTLLALVGMALGVAALVAVMGVVSGFQNALQSAVTDITGHMLVIRRGEPLENMDRLLPRLKKAAPSLTSTMPFVYVEAMMAAHGKISGVIVQGLEPKSFNETLNLGARLVEGNLALGTGAEDVPQILIGKGIKDKLDLKVGEDLHLVLPKSAPQGQSSGFVPQVKKFKVGGVLDLGMYEYDSRFVMMTALAAQKLASMGPFFTGVRLKIQKADQAPDVAANLASELGASYLVRDWMEAHHNLFEAIKLEKIVIFVVLLFMTIAACFNVASTLYISVLRRTHDIAILKTMGAQRPQIARFFTLQGLFLGMLGTLLGILLGLGICFLITHTQLIDVPAEIYHLNRLPITIKFFEMTMIVVSSLALCLLSTWGPAQRAAKQWPVEGLRYE